MPIYKLHGIDTVIKNNHTYIPFEPSNRDYQEYLDWVGLGNTPDPADPVIEPEDIPTQEERLAALELVVSMVFAEDDADV